MPRYRLPSRSTSLGEHPISQAVPSSMLGPSSQASKHVRGAHALRVDVVHLGGSELRQLAELLVRHEALEPLAVKPRCKSVEPTPARPSEKRAPAT